MIDWSNRTDVICFWMLLALVAIVFLTYGIWGSKDE